MKKIKYIVFVVGFFLLLRAIIVFVVRAPSYTIQTSGKLYTVNKLSSSITVFDLFHGENISEIPINVQPYKVTSFSNLNKVIVANYGSDDVVGNSITVIDAKTNTIENTFPLEGSLRPYGIVSFPQSSKVAVVTHIGNNFLVVDAETGVIEKDIPTNQIVSNLLVLDPTKPLAYVTNTNSNSVSVIDLNFNFVIKNIHCGLGTFGIDITPDGSEIWVTNKKENSISVINTETYQVVNILKTGEEPLCLRFSIDGQYCLVTNSNDGTVTVYNQKTKRLIKTIQIPGKKGLVERILYHTPRPLDILMHPNGHYAFVSNSNANKIEVIDMKTFKIISTIGTGKIPDGLAFIK
ncbi:YVTN family beta-propeller repeat protein [Yeosuana sp. AK3]